MHMNVLSLFDGMSCGQIALDELGIPVDKYFAAEIDKHAIKVAKANYPDMVHLGDVREVWVSNDLNTKEKGISHEGKIYEIDLLIGGSPCQGFSFAGQQLNFDDPRSMLFFEYVRLLKALNPRYFLLENVKMKKESQDIISEYLGVEPIEINSNLVSAQNRKRLYWTNIPVDGLPEDKGIVLADILEDGATDRKKSHCIDANYWKGGNLKSYFKKNRRQLVFDSEVKGARIVNRRLDENGKRKDNDKSIPLQTQLELRLDDKAGCLTTVQKDSVVAYPLILQKARGYNKGGLKAKDGKTPTISTSAWEHNNHLTMDEGTTWRKLTPTEVERLQTVPDGYTDHVSNTQRYKMLGNGWTVEVIKHIMKGMM
jgi:DNA-cytosine methyltransferase